MNTLTFDRAAVEDLLEHSESAAKQAALCGEEVKEPSLIIVGDTGVYLVSNGEPAQMVTESRRKVVYANECNPEKMDFDSWWETKNRTFGGDDGGESIPCQWFRALIERMPEGRLFEIGFSENNLSLAVIA